MLNGWAGHAVHLGVAGLLSIAIRMMPHPARAVYRLATAHTITTTAARLSRTAPRCRRMGSTARL